LKLVEAVENVRRNLLGSEGPFQCCEVRFDPLDIREVAVFGEPPKYSNGPVNTRLSISILP